MSPILIRPVREQLEHDRLVRFLLLNKYKRRLEAIANVGDEHLVSMKLGTSLFFPDIAIIDGKKLAGVVEVETGESVNNLEALAQWVHFGKAKVPFHLYVPVTSYDSAQRLCDQHHVKPTEVWTYRGAMDGFDLVRMQQNPVSTQGRVAVVERVLPVKPKPVEVPVEKPVVAPPVAAKKGVVAVPPAKAGKAVPPPPAPVKGAKPAVPASPAKPAPPAKDAKAAKTPAAKAPVAPKPAKAAAKPVKAGKPAKPAPKPAAKAHKAKPQKHAKSKKR